MKVVVDTNVLVAGLLSPFGPPGEIVRMMASGSLSLCWDARILTEYQDGLNRPKFGFDPNHTIALLAQIHAQGMTVAANPLSETLPDSNDHPFLEVALAGQAQCLITGNLKHFPPSKRQGMTVLSPSQFIEFYRERTIRGKFMGTVNLPRLALSTTSTSLKTGNGRNLAQQ